jgi:hypothetical protein
MQSHGHATVWGTHIGIGRASGGKSWYQQLRDWWMTRRAARHEAQLAALKARWDVRREVVTPYRANAAAEMIAAQGGFSTMGQLHEQAL